jgi:hypothetical protein
MYRKIFVSIALILLSVVILKAQLSTSSPYSRYGIGDLSYKGLGRTMSLGHCANGIQNPYNINPVNPASYSAFMPNSFIFEIGAIHKFTYFETNENNWYTNNSNLDYLVAGFAVKSWWGTSFGMQPVSSVGYSLESSDSLFVDDGYSNIDQKYFGEGGLNKFYWGNSFQPIKNISIGFNISYIFGSADRNTETLISQTDYYAITQEFHRYLIKGLNYNFGLQFTDSLSSKKDTTKNSLIYTLGFTFDNGSSINAFDTRQIIRQIGINSNVFRDTLVNDTLEKTKVMLPQSIGAGISLKFNQQFTVAADYSIENWKGLTIFNDNYTMFNSSFLGLGLEYCNNEYSTIYKKTFRYRLGGYYQKTHLNIKEQQINQYGVTLGLGLTIKSSILNLGFEFGARGTTDFNLVKESYILFNLNFSLYDVWFVKSKFF